MPTLRDIQLSSHSNIARRARQFYVKRNRSGHYDVLMKDQKSGVSIIAENHLEGDCNLIESYTSIIDGLLSAFSQYHRGIGEEYIRQAELMLRHSTLQEDLNKTWGLGGNEQDSFHLTITPPNGSTARIGGSLYVNQATALYIQRMPENLSYLLKKVKNTYSK